MLVMGDPKDIDLFPDGYSKNVPSQLMIDVIGRAVFRNKLYLMSDDTIIKIILTIRTTKNNVMTRQEKEVAVETVLNINPADCNNYDNVYLTIAKYVKDTFNFPPEVMRESALQLTGTLNNPDFFGICSQLIIKDEYKEVFEPTISSMKFEHINNIHTFTNLSGWTKIFLPTLNIVKE